MPPCFISRISRSNSGFVTAGPYHHHRTIMRASSGGFWNPRCNSAMLTGSAPNTNPAISAMSALLLNNGTDISTIVFLRAAPRQLVSSAERMFQLRKQAPPRW